MIVAAAVMAEPATCVLATCSSGARFAKAGKEGETVKLDLELRLLADAALIVSQCG